MLFKDRRDAGRRLAGRLGHYAGASEAIVLGLPRGGVVVAYEVAGELGLPLDVLVVRKLGAPGHEELAIGAIASGGVKVLNEDIIAMLAISAHDIERIAVVQQHELDRRAQDYRGNRSEVDVAEKTVIVVDDGLATGATMRAAVEALRAQDVGKTVVAVPTAPLETCRMLEEHADEVVCLTMPEPFYGVGGSYMDFTQTTDDEVRSLLDRAQQFVATTDYGD